MKGEVCLKCAIRKGLKVTPRSHHYDSSLYLSTNIPTKVATSLWSLRQSPRKDFKGQGHYGKVKGQIKVYCDAANPKQMLPWRMNYVMFLRYSPDNSWHICPFCDNIRPLSTLDTKSTEILMILLNIKDALSPPTPNDELLKVANFSKSVLKIIHPLLTPTCLSSLYSPCKYPQPHPILDTERIPLVSSRFLLDLRPGVGDWPPQCRHHPL